MVNMVGYTESLALLLFTILVVRAIYVFIFRYWNYFSDRNITFHRGAPLLGSLYKTFLGTDSFLDSVTQIYNQHAKDHRIVGMYEIGGRPSHLVLDAKLVRDITIKDFDHFVNHHFQLDNESDPLMSRILFSMTNEKWRNMRSTLSPLFTGSKMRFMIQLMNESTKEFVSHVHKEILDKSPKTGIEYNMEELLTCLTSDMIGSTAFGLQMNTIKDKHNNEFYQAGIRLAYALMSLKTFFIMAFPKLTAWLGIKILNSNDENFFRNVIRETVNVRQKSNVVRNDMLQLLLQVKEGQLNNEMEEDTQQDTGFATVQEILAAKTTEKLKSMLKMSIGLDIISCNVIISINCCLVTF